jgi:hypothetical protein
LTLCRSLVTPAIALNSPAESVVGTVICLTVGASQGSGPSTPSGPVHRAEVVQCLERADIVGEAQLHRLGAVGDRATVDRGN